MLDTGGYSGTDWSTTEVIDMWLAIGNQDTAPHWEVVDGWRKSAELVDQHLQAVKSYRKNLADAWPPEKSAASAAYAERLDHLIEHLQHTVDAATANLEAFRSATLALDDARPKLATIVDEYYANEAALKKFDQEQSQPPPAGRGNYKVPEPKPPVPAGRQEELASQARGIMYGLSHELTTAQTQIVQPPQYVPSYGSGDDKQKHSGTTSPAPAIPAVVPFDPHSSSSSSARASTSVQAPTAHTAAPASGPAKPSPTPGRQPGLVLGGVGATPSVPTPVPPGNVPLPTPVSPSPLPNVIPPTPLLPVESLGSPAIGSRNVAGGAGMTDSFGRTALPGAANAVRAMPPGGVIGGQPGVGLGQPGAGRSMQKVNPAGGLLSPGATQGRPGAGPASRTGLRSAGSPGEAFGTPPGRMRERGRDASKEQEPWDPDNPWETVDGVDPVLLPPREQRVDPGPAIGLG